MHAGGWTPAVGVAMAALTCAMKSNPRPHRLDCLPWSSADEALSVPRSEIERSRVSTPPHAPTHDATTGPSVPNFPPTCSTIDEGPGTVVVSRPSGVAGDYRAISQAMMKPAPQLPKALTAP